MLDPFVTSDGGKRIVKYLCTKFLIGMLAKTMAAPFEMAKMIKQDQFIKKSLFGKKRNDKGYTDLSTYGILLKLYFDHGLAGLFVGNTANVMRFWPTQLLNYHLKDYIKAMFPKVDKTAAPRKAFIVDVLSGGAVGAASLLAVYPMDMVRCKMITSTPEDPISKSKTFGEAMARIILENPEQGLLSLYSGYGISIAGIIPFRGMYFGVQRFLARHNPFRENSGLIGVLSKSLTAQVAAVSAATSTYPLDTIRRGQQEYPEKSAWEVLQEVLKAGGWSALFYGAGANAMRTVMSAMILVIQGEVKHAFERQTKPASG